MRATLLTNLVYPVYKHGENVVHYTPGKRWDSFYTWDSGVIGTGVLEFSPEKCRYILETYLSQPENTDFAFLLHGSLVPTQFVQYLELLHRTEDKAPLFALYPQMKRYYDYISGKTPGSTCGKFGNGLTTTYDYWYSCSGMDDYPAQVAMIAQDKKQYMCPCLSTSHTIRAAKIMKMVAAAMGKEEDIAAYDADIQRMSDALNRYSWDEKSGYYAYSVYDDDKNYQGIFTTDAGENYDKGMDGVYPLFAGAAPEERRERLLAHIKNPDEMWSAAGISAVDMTASYYFDDGYWNGNVWMSHQSLCGRPCLTWARRNLPLRSPAVRWICGRKRRTSLTTPMSALVFRPAAAVGSTISAACPRYQCVGGLLLSSGHLYLRAGCVDG